MAVEYDHHDLIKWKSFLKMVQIRLDVTVDITGMGSLEHNIERAGKYIKNLKCIMYIVSLKVMYIVSLKDREYKYLK